jgi:cold shock CspA family protein
MQGVVTSLASDRGFGFIRRDDSPRPLLFFHLSQLRSISWERLRVGDRVEFEIGAGHDGRPVAEGIRGIEGRFTVGDEDGSFTATKLVF